MPRRAWLDAPGTLHHVIVRGIEKRRIVNDVANRKNLVNKLMNLSAGYARLKGYRLRN
jgi:putative transposase